MAESPFPGWLPETAADGVVVRPDDINAEARSNLWTFSLSPEEAAAVTAAEVEGFVRAVAAARGHWLEAHRAGGMLLYCWHDQQAGQLRVSLVSESHGWLPFGCTVERVAELGAVVRGFLSSDSSGLPSPLLVWVIPLP